MNKIPGSVKILYKEYEIEEVDNLHDTDGELYGQIQYLPQKIHLNSGSSEEQKKATLIHEIMHGLDEMYNIGLGEKQIEKLGNAVYMLIKDNPEMFRSGKEVNEDA